MFGWLRDLVLRRVVKSALAFENDARNFYSSLEQSLEDTNARMGIEHLIHEEDLHKRVVTDLAEGRLSYDGIEEMLAQHRFHDLDAILALDERHLAAWGDELEMALENEKSTYTFYTNLSKISRIPVIRLAFEMLADMEREHIQILVRLLGKQGDP